MRIQNSRIFRYALPLKAGWRSASSSFAERSGWLLCLETADGLFGWGDCAPLPGAVPPHDLLHWYHGLSGLDLVQAQHRLSQSNLTPAARCAVDTALSDLAAQRAGLPLARWLNPGANLTVACNAALGVLDETALVRALSAVEAGFNMLKLKVGVAGVEQELAWLRQVVVALPQGVLLRLDANRAWGEENAQRFLAGVEGLPLEMLEEPLAQPDLTRLGALQRQTGIALALDESLPGLGMAPVMAARAVPRLVLKPMLLGGLHASLEWAHQAREHGMECVVTTTLDSAVGTLAAAHLAAALDNGLRHGLATSAWLVRDVGRTPRIEDGMMPLGEQPGLGFSPDWNELSPL